MDIIYYKTKFCLFGILFPRGKNLYVPICRIYVHIGDLYATYMHI